MCTFWSTPFYTFFLNFFLTIFKALNWELFGAPAQIYIFTLYPGPKFTHDQIYLGPKFTHHQIYSRPKFTQHQIYPQPKFTQKIYTTPDLHRPKFTQTPNLHRPQTYTNPISHKSHIYTWTSRLKLYTRENSEYCTEKMKPPKRDYFECLCSSMLEVTVNIPVEKQYASRSNHIWGHKRHIYFRNGTLTITLDEIAMHFAAGE